MKEYSEEELRFLARNWDTCSSNCWCCKTDCIMNGGCIKRVSSAKKTDNKSTS